MRARTSYRIPNLVVASRVVLAFVAAGLLFAGSAAAAVAAVGLIVVVIAMDALDGIAARRLGLASKLGGILDITADRIVEHVFWITFAVAHQVGLWVPLVAAAVKTDSDSYAIIGRTGAFAVSVLGEDQLDIGKAFFRTTKLEGDTLNGYRFEPGPETGCPILVDLPYWGREDEELNQLFSDLHFWSCWGLLLAMAAHIGAALLHAFRDDGVVRRILRW